MLNELSSSFPINTNILTWGLPTAFFVSQISVPQRMARLKDQLCNFACANKHVIVPVTIIGGVVGLGYLYLRSCNSKKNSSRSIDGVGRVGNSVLSTQSPKDSQGLKPIDNPISLKSKENIPDNEYEISGEEILDEFKIPEDNLSASPRDENIHEMENSFDVVKVKAKVVKADFPGNSEPFYNLYLTAQSLVEKNVFVKAILHGSVTKKPVMEGSTHVTKMPSYSYRFVVADAKIGLTSQELTTQFKQHAITLAKKEDKDPEQIKSNKWVLLLTPKEGSTVKSIEIKFKYGPKRIVSRVIDLAKANIPEYLTKNIDPYICWDLKAYFDRNVMQSLPLSELL
jgi:hypothetical protein